MLSFWEKDFSSSIDEHLGFLNKNLEDQDIYSLKFSEIFRNMDIFKSNNDENNKDGEEKDKKQEDKSENSDDNQSDGKEDKNKQDDAQKSLDTGFDLSDQQMDEQLEDSESFKESKESIVQKTNSINIDQEYKILQQSLMK